MQDEIVNSTLVDIINPNNPDNYVKNLNQIYLGPKVQADLIALKLNPKDIEKFQRRCLTFLVQLSNEIYKRFPFTEKHIGRTKYFSFVYPENIFGVRSISIVADIFKKDRTKIDLQYRAMREHLHDHLHLNTFDFWKAVKVQGIYPDLSDLVDKILVLPHSSATCERVFSMVAQNKTSARQAMELGLLSGLMWGKSLPNLNEKNCYDFEVNKKFVSLHNISMYDFKK